MKNIKISTLLGWLFFTSLALQIPPLYAATPPSIPLAQVYQSDVDISHYWISEKLDGVRAYWTGKQLISKQGNPYPAPRWFTANFPSQPLDGELWIKRGRFEELVSTVRQQQPDDRQWRRVTYQVFDAPQQGVSFGKRLNRVRALLKAHPSPYLVMVDQFRLKDHATLMERLDEVIRQGGEGLMMHRADALYIAGRSDKLLKVKRYEDAEARVIAHLAGKGKYLGMLGALRVETDDGKQFSLGSGFSDEQRDNPPPIGSFVTYKYTGKTAKGIPRFASFLRIYDEP